ncbi:MAG: hypothetical protein AB1603_02430 [Chloroflexota bacterium]
MSAYAGVKRLAVEHPDWIPVVKVVLRTAERHNEFAGAWVLEEARKEGITWFPGLRILVRYGVLQHLDTTRGGRRAYYTMPDPEGVGEALSELAGS